MSFLAGNGNGTFKAKQVTMTVANTPNALAIADFNLDGKLDVANGNSAGNNVGFAYGDGKGTFPLIVGYVAGTNPLAVVAVDLNKDNKPDLVAGNNASHDINVLLNNL